MKPIHEFIKEKLQRLDVPFKANDNISAWLGPADKEELQGEVEKAVQYLLNTLIIDTTNDHNTHDTAKRVAKMFIKEIFRGRYEPMPKITEFPNDRQLDEVYTLGPIKFKSACSHHLITIDGECWVGILPDKKVVGISKIARIVDWIARRPQIQEEATVMIADLIEDIIKPKGVGVIIKAKHFCMVQRGVEQENSVMTTSVMRGEMRDNPSLKSEFLALIK